VNIGKGGDVFRVYPNPVRGNIVTVQLNDLAKGNYTLNLYNAAGQQVMSKLINHNGSNVSETVILPILTAGVYTLQLTGGDVKFQKPLIIETSTN